MRTGKKIYVTKTLLKDDELSELDFVLQDEFKVNHEEDDDFNVIEPKSGYANATPVKIDTLIKFLTKWKTKGVTHVEINDHCDHHGYIVSGYEIRKSTPVEIEKYEKKRSEYLLKEKKVSELYAEIEKLKK